VDNDLLFPVKRHRVAPVVGWSVGVGVVTWLLFSWPGLPWVAIAPAVLALAITGLAWLVVAVRSISRPAQRGPALAAAVVLAVAVGGIGLHLPLTARFAVSQPSFQALVDEAGPPPTTGAELADSESSVRCPGRVGL